MRSNTAKPEANHLAQAVLRLSGGARRCLVRDDGLAKSHPAYQATGKPVPLRDAQKSIHLRPGGGTISPGGRHLAPLLFPFKFNDLGFISKKGERDLCFLSRMRCWIRRRKSAPYHRLKPITDPFNDFGHCRRRAAPGYLLPGFALPLEEGGCCRKPSGLPPG